MERLGVGWLVELWLVDFQCHLRKWCLMNNHNDESGVVRDLALLQHECAYACHGIGRKLVLNRSHEPAEASESGGSGK